MSRGGSGVELFFPFFTRLTWISPDGLNLRQFAVIVNEKKRGKCDRGQQRGEKQVYDKAVSSGGI